MLIYFNKAVLNPGVSRRGRALQMQPDLFSYTPPAILGQRDGVTFEPKRDTARLNGQAADVYNFMKSGNWVSLKQISEATGHPEASCSARFRDFSKPKLGNMKTEKRNLGGGKWVYRLAGKADKS